MKSESILDAAFSGFRLVRERPRTIAAWAAVQLVFTLAVSLIMVWTGGAALTRLATEPPQARSDPSQALTLLAQVAPMYLLLVLASALFYSVFLAAANRALLRPDDSRFSYLRVGADELRQLGLIASLVLLMIGLYIAIAIAMFIVLFVVSGLAGAGRGASGTGVISTSLIGFVLFLLIVVGMIFVWVRLSLASPLTFATRRINLFGSWSLTRGRFWATFGVYALVFVMMIGVYLVGFTLLFAVAGLMGGGSAYAMLFKPDLSSIGGYFSPARIVVIVLQSALATLVLPVMLCPAIDIYRRVTGSSDLATVFS